MILITIPILEGLKKEWREACESLGASQFTYWRKVAFPILLPSLLGTMLLLFGNSFGAYATAYALAARLGIDAARLSVAFQSRLGRTPWILPHTDAVLADLAARGTRTVAVVCPAFVADCLETLEEIGLRAADAFRAAGGGDLVLVPSLNAHPAWVTAVADLARRRAAQIG